MTVRDLMRALIEHDPDMKVAVRTGERKYGLYTTTVVCIDKPMVLERSGSCYESYSDDTDTIVVLEEEDY